MEFVNSMWEWASANPGQAIVSAIGLFLVLGVFKGVAQFSSNLTSSIPGAAWNTVKWGARTAWAIPTGLYGLAKIARQNSLVKQAALARYEQDVRAQHGLPVNAVAQGGAVSSNPTVPPGAQSSLQHEVAMLREANRQSQELMKAHLEASGQMQPMQRNPANNI